MSRRLKSEVLSVTQRDRNVIHHNEAENEEFVFYDDDKRCGARGRTVVTLQPPGDRGPRDTIGCQPLQMLMLILTRARLLPTLSFIKISDKITDTCRQ